MRSRILAAGLAAALMAFAPGVGAQAPAWQVCFTPGQDCTGLIVDEIGGARRSILIHAYSLTSVPILVAPKAAHARGVDVEVIVDRTSARVSKSGSRYSAATYLSNAGIPVWIDTRVAIAHNKVMVLDGATVITGSFNFTATAQAKNAENLLVIHDVALATRYRENWKRRGAGSMSYAGPLQAAPQAEERRIDTPSPSRPAYVTPVSIACGVDQSPRPAPPQRSIKSR
jgi:phosphatidylserine/phosphatidylglycerophosphate/cardiolipin synthase-like enzyme